jgi:hypothetical protein
VGSLKKSKQYLAKITKSEPKCLNTSEILTIYKVFQWI